MNSVSASEARQADPAQRPSRILRTAFRTASAIHCALYRASRGRLGGSANGVPLLLLTTTGRRTGSTHTVPVGYVDQGDHLLLTGSGGGMPWHPAWYLNVRTNPRVTVELGGERRVMMAEALDGAERAALWDAVVAAYPVFERYQRKVRRHIGVVRLRPVPPAA